ncbi:MAG TPA: hypothetical protein EYG90_06860 [Campylobacterales bacterium]|nr:hypothetical protein [Campylobacterales bacterium]
MTTKKILLFTFFSSIFLYSEPISPINSFDKNLLSLEKNETKKTVKENNQTEDTSSKIDEISIKLEKTLTKKSALLHDIHHKKFIKRFYRQNNYTPLWITQKGLEKRVSELFKAINSDITLGSKSQIIQQYQHIEQYIKNKNSEKNKIHIELKLSVLYFDFLQHRLYGSIKWRQFASRLKKLRKKGVGGHWIKHKPPYSLSELMLKPNILETMNQITPKYFGYKGLLKSLQKLQTMELKGGWEKLPIFKKLELGDQGVNVISLRKRLKISGDLKECKLTAQKLFEKDTIEETEDSIKFQPDATFDVCLADAVKKFQLRHGLTTDGIVGVGTIKALNISVEAKIETVLLNLDRIKWLPRELDERYLVVNIPEYMLHYMESGQDKQNIKVIVGDTRHPTPIFGEEISYIVLNPYWKIPEGIVRREIIPAMIRNPNYIRKQGLEIRTTWYERSPRVHPQDIYWEQYRYGAVKFPYRIMQAPGKKNALGKIKFKFPNRFAVYLHDTPTRHLFKRDKRAFSHGCIRVDEPTTLLKTIASFNKSINLKKAMKTLKGKRKTQLNISNRIHVHIIYLTAGFDNNTAELQFRNDIYGYDAIQKKEKH